MRDVIQLGRKKREEVKVGLRTPLSRLTIVHSDPKVLSDLRSLESYIATELNVKEILFDDNESEYIELLTKPNFPVLGKRLGKRMKEFAAAINCLDSAAALTLLEGGNVELQGESFDSTEIEVLRRAKGDSEVVSDRYISILLDCEVSPALLREGYAREIVNRVQQARKDRGLQVADRISLNLFGNADLLVAAEAHREYLMAEVLALTLVLAEPEDGDPEVSVVDATIDGKPLQFVLAVSATD
jgi:isoleucyl-tRNA synthetase